MNTLIGIYKYVYNNKIIYIGKSDSSIYNRIKTHINEDKFQPYLKECKIYYFVTSNPAETKVYETYLIDKYKPILNVIDKYVDGACVFNIPEPNWILYEEKIFKQINPSKKQNVSNIKHIKNNNDIEFELKSLYQKMGVTTVSNESTISLIKLAEQSEEKNFYCFC
jgi:excinuclease UvrABC nuclease subunit